MATKRYEIYKKFKQFIQDKDNRSMDKICNTDNSKFYLQAQQLFLKEYMIEYPEWKILLLYHSIGSGKTCSAITMAEQYLKTYPNNHIKVILPARLKTNFIDELNSACGNKSNIPKYDIMSIERFRINTLKNKNNLKQYFQNFTKDSMIIIDEVHNLISDKYNKDEFKTILETGKISSSTKGINSIIFKLLNIYKDISTKCVYLTATPIFDNINQFKELVTALEPNTDIKENSLNGLIEYLRGKVSYFPGISVNAYPKFIYNIHDIPLSKTQENEILNIGKDAFFMKERLICLSCASKINLNKVIKNMDEYCPKIKKCIDIIENNPGKHVVYSNFIESGLSVLEAVLKTKGWIDIKSVINDETKWLIYKDKVYALWDGKTHNSDKQKIKNIVNSIDNIFGNKIKVILGSPSIKEGISFKHVQHIHILDSMWNQSTKSQIEGRAIRYCSHIDIKKEHKPLKRTVVIDIYKSVPRKNGHITKTCDQKIYDELLIKKHNLVSKGEEALKKVAIDHYLFRNIYLKNKAKSPKYSTGKSNLDIQENI